MLIAVGRKIKAWFYVWVSRTKDEMHGAMVDQNPSGLKDSRTIESRWKWIFIGWWSWYQRNQRPSHQPVAVFRRMHICQSYGTFYNITTLAKKSLTISDIYFPVHNFHYTQLIWWALSGNLRTPGSWSFLDQQHCCAVSLSSRSK